MSGRQLLVLVLVGLASSLAYVDVTPAEASYATTVEADNPVAYYRMDESSGTTMVSQVSPGTTNGTYVNSPTLGVTGAPLVPADTDKAVHFGGTSVAQTPFLFDVAATAWTMELWINPSVTPVGDVEVISQIDLSGTGRGDIYFNPAGGLASFLGGTENDWAGGTLPLNTWTFVALTYDGTGTLHWYENGAPAGTNSPSPVVESDSGGFILAANKFGNSGFFNGGLDEVAFFTTQLSAGQIHTQYVPEPASLGLLLLAAPLLARRRRVR